MPNITAIVGAALGAVILALGIWLGVTKIQLAGERALNGRLSGQVETASQQIVQATADIKSCGATNDQNQAAIAGLKQSDADQLAAVTADYERRLADAQAIKTEEGKIDADALACPALGGVPASIRSAIDWLRGTAAPAATPASANHHP